ncbi:MAG: hypothetical protein V1703_01805 [Candidatus Altiarchaeota archaeon]
MKIVPLFLAFCVLSLLASCSSADGIGEGQKPIDFCARISNTNDFPEYVFVVFKDYLARRHEVVLPTRGYIIINDSDCIPFGYKGWDGGVYAIPKSSFNEEDLKPLAEYLSNWTENPSYNSDHTLEYVKKLQYVPVINDPYNRTYMAQRAINSVNDPTVKITYEYTITTKDDKLVLEMKQIDKIGWLYLFLMILFIAFVECIFVTNMSSWYCEKVKRVFPRIFLINMISYPIGAYIILNISDSILLVEAVIILLEWALIAVLFKTSIGRSLAISLLINIASWFIGFALLDLVPLLPWLFSEISSVTGI